MYQRITLTIVVVVVVMVMAVAVASCKKSHRIDPVSVVGIKGCGNSDFMHPILVRMSGPDGNNELLIQRQENSRVAVRGDKETTWDIELFECSNELEAGSEWECEVPEAPYHKSQFVYDPKSPSKLAIVAPEQGMKCREKAPAKVEL